MRLSSWWKIEDNVGTSDIILGIGIGVTKNGKASRLSQAVAQKVADLYHQGLAQKVLLVGGFTQANVSEAEAMRRIVAERGIPSKDILLETESKSTLANARLGAELLKQMDIKAVLVVAQEIHARRAIATFKKTLPKHIGLYWSLAHSGYDVVPNQKRLSSEKRFLLWELFWYTYYKIAGWT